MHWLLYGLLFIWQLPQNIVALIMMPFLGKLTPIAKNKWSCAYRGEKMSGGISLGSFIFLSPYSAGRETSVRHEFGHAVDSRLFGPLYLLIIGLPSLLNAAFGFTECYFDFYTERRANHRAGLVVDEYCGLQIEGHEGLTPDGADLVWLENNPDGAE